MHDLGDQCLNHVGHRGLLLNYALLKYLLSNKWNKYEPGHKICRLVKYRHHRRCRTTGRPAGVCRRGLLTVHESHDADAIYIPACHYHAQVLHMTVIEATWHAMPIP